LSWHGATVTVSWFSVSSVSLPNFGFQRTPNSCAYFWLLLNRRVENITVNSTSMKATDRLSKKPVLRETGHLQRVGFLLLNPYHCNFAKYSLGMMDKTLFVGQIPLNG
jgi:hypothetical protein